MNEKRKIKEELTKALTLSLTNSEIKKLEEISKKILGKKNKTGIVRYWIYKETKETK